MKSKKKENLITEKFKRDIFLEKKEIEEIFFD